MEAVPQTVPQFQVWDYVVFSLLLVISAAIGLFYACTGGKQSTTKEFLLADKRMNVIPVAMSMLASFMSAITLMGNPAEVYNYGTQFIIIGLSYSMVIPAAAHLYMPIFYNLNITSAYEYLELRFSKGVRLAASMTFMMQMVFYMAIVLYAPALALNQVTGLNVWISVLSVGVVCTFYTALGGMKAVMWTDLIQMLIMFAGMIVILVKGSADVGGFSEVWRIAQEGDRIELFNMNPDPRVRHTFWTLTFGATFTWLAIYGVNQAQVQRALSVSTLRKAQLAIYLNVPGLIGLLTITVGCGLVIFAKYQQARCDPVLNGQVKTADQLVPLFVMESLQDYPGLPGLFVAAIFSGALSTLSSGFNSLAAITLQDVIRNYWVKDMPEKRATLYAKCLALGFGVLCIALSYVASFMGGVLQAALAIFGMVGGPLLGLFTLGMFFPWANYKGAYTGLFGSLVMTMWIGLGANIVYPPINPKKPFCIDGCRINNITANFTAEFMNSTYAPFNGTTFATHLADRPLVAELYAVSYLYYSVIAVIVCVVLGLTVSFITGAQKPSDLDPRLITPILAKILCCVPPSQKKKLWCGVKHDKAIIIAAEQDNKISLADSDDVLDPHTGVRYNRSYDGLLANEILTARL